MGIDIGKRYSSSFVEAGIYDEWLKKGYFTPENIKGERKFTIVIPPPNVTDILHLGHALNNIIQDLIIRYERMKGAKALWIPGTDHAGIATQHMVELELAKENLTRESLGRERFLERVWQYKEEKGGIILEQLKEIGCSCDWTRTRFTLDAGLSRAVKEAFCRLYEEGLIYRGRYVINWCPHCRTALANDEVEHENKAGYLWYIFYPFADYDGGITVATTRPETMLGDTAVAVHPDDDRYRDFIGRLVRLPLTNRLIPIIADYKVERAFGTGAVKVTPAHDPVDFEIAKRHGLDAVFVIGENGRMTNEAGKDFVDLDRFEAREKVLKMLKEKGLLVKVEPYEYAVGHCYRCHTVIEPYLSEQWFVKMKPLATPAIAAVERGLVKFFPERWKGVYLNWMENIQDWCISRQIWWGHEIPVWWCNECKKETVSRTTPQACVHCGSNNIYRDDDVLDTWFSSWLWPFSTLGWPDITDDIRRYYPTDVLVTASEIIFFWVARMIMAGLHFMGEIPFSKVLIHGTVRDELGRKMSKSLGNGIDPLLVVREYGRDPLRFTLISQAGAGQDLFIALKTFENGRNFLNKLWNASRFILSNIDTKYDYSNILLPSYDDILDKAILSKLERTKGEVTQAIEEFKLNEYISIIYRFFWHDFCDWYIEGVKNRLKDPEDKKTRGLLLYILTEVLKLLHPVVPFITEHLWSVLYKNFLTGLESESIIVARWSKKREEYIDPSAEAEFELLRDLVVAIRGIRHLYNLSAAVKIPVYVYAPDEQKRGFLERNAEYIRFFAGLSELFISEKALENPEEVVNGIEIFVPVEGFVDVDATIKRFERELKELEMLVVSLRKKLVCDEFLMKAPKNVVESEKRKLEELELKMSKLTRTKEILKKGGMR